MRKGRWPEIQKPKAGEARDIYKRWASTHLDDHAAVLLDVLGRVGVILLAHALVRADDVHLDLVAAEDRERG